MSKLWVEQEVLNGNTFLPSFQEAAHAWLGVCAAEDVKYPEPWQKGGKMVTAFLRDLAQEYDNMTHQEKMLTFSKKEYWKLFWERFADKHGLPKKPERQLRTRFKHP